MDDDVRRSLPQEKPGLRLNIPPPNLNVSEKSPGRLSPVIPSFRITSSPAAPPEAPSRLPSANEKFHSVNKIQAELQKLLAHVLSRLKGRSKPPSVYERLRTETIRKHPLTLGAVVETVRNAVRFKQVLDRPEVPPGRGTNDDDIDDNEQEFSTDETYDLLTQLRDLLVLAQKQGCEILRPQEGYSSNRESSSLRRLGRLSPQRSVSPTRNPGKPPELLLECIDILASIVTEDGRYKVSAARLSRPTYALQAICLDIAQILISQHLDDAKILSIIGFAMIPAFSSFSPSLHGRLLSFFETILIRRMLEDLQGIRGLEESITADVPVSFMPGSKNPVVAIQVDAAADDPPTDASGPGWKQWSSTLAAVALSSIAPSQSMNVYYLSSLVPPLLAAILDSFDPFEISVRDISRLYHFDRILQTIIAMKQDSYLDILEIVAYHGAHVRRKALSLLATYWPKALGHTIIGKALPTFGYFDILSSQSSHMPLAMRVAPPRRDDPYAHEFIPWKFAQDPTSSEDPQAVRNSCHACSKPINDFGLLCPFCTVAVHLNCYDSPEGTYHGEYEPFKGADQKPCFFSFSHVLCSRRDKEPPTVAKGRHVFRSANLFTLALCGACCKPMWGCTKQGMKCTLCHRFAHASCVAGDADTLPACQQSTLSSAHVTIDPKALRDSFTDYYWKILLPEEEISKRSYEEISIYYSILWAQLRLFEHGISYKSIDVKQGGLGFLPTQRQSIAEFELHRFVRLYEKHLSSNASVKSEALLEYLDFNNRAHPYGYALLYDWPLLTSITSLMKSPLVPQSFSTPSRPNLLQVSEPETDPVDVDSHPYELLSLSQARAALGHELNIQADIAAKYLLSHIGQVGFFERIGGADLFEGPQDNVLCAFPLPSGLDLSTS
ncbi:hypothetical protein M422DRAFT_252558, partial [Sphaerobolus stellatus SS14]